MGLLLRYIMVIVGGIEAQGHYDGVGVVVEEDRKAPSQRHHILLCINS